MENSDLHARLEDVAARIEVAAQHLERMGSLHGAHRATNKELLARYRVLKAELDEEVATEEARGRRVGALEKSLRMWLNSIDYDA